MTIQEILNEHEPSRWRSFTNENEILRCCGKDFGNATKKAKRGDGHLAWTQFNAHVAEVLNKRMQEREAKALEDAADELDKSKQPARIGLPMMLRADWLRNRASQIGKES